MKFFLLTTILALTTLALPNPSPNLHPKNYSSTPHPPTNTTRTPRSPITAITMQLSAKKANVGGTPYPALYNNIYRAITQACPFTSLTSACTHAPSTFKVRTHAAPGVAPFQTDVTVTVTAARWFANRALYKLMVGAIAGAIERGTYAPRNCQSFKEREGGAMTAYTFCNTVAGAGVALPGALPYHMRVSLEAVPSMGDFECSGIASTVEGYLDELKPEFQRALGMPDMYVQATCVYD